MIALSLFPLLTACLSVCSNAQISAIIGAGDTKVGMRIAVYPAQLELKSEFAYDAN